MKASLCEASPPPRGGAGAATIKLNRVVEAQKGLKVTFTTKIILAALRTLIVDFQAIFTA